jgi:hypothetical protein
MTSRFLRSHVLGIVAIAIAVGGTAIAAQAANNSATASRGKFVTKAQFRKLKQRVKALEGRTSYPPSGAAGGSLNGSYPNPGLANNSVGSSEIKDGSVGSADLKGIYAAVTAGIPAPSGTFVNGTATCNPGDRVLSGGHSFQNDAGINVVYSTPDPLTNPNSWVVRADSSTANTMYVWAVCLAN